MKTLDIDFTENNVTGADVVIVVDEDAPIGAGPVLDADIVNEDLDPDDRLPSHAKLNANGSVTLPLLYPQVIRSQKNGKIRETTYAELTLNRLNGADLNAFNATSAETQSIVLLARSTRITQAVMAALFEKMDGADISHALQVISHFLPSGRKTGRS